MGDGLVCRILQQADTAGVDFVHAAGVLRNIARRTTLQNDHLQSGSRGYFFRHHQAAPTAANDHYIRGFKPLQPMLSSPPPSISSERCAGRRQTTSPAR